MECVPTEIPGYFRPCINKCDPYTLIFDPHTGSCVFESYPEDPICEDTPDATASPTAIATSASTQETTKDPDDCEYPGQTFVYPGHCHLYYICLPNEDDGYFYEVFDCGELVFNISTGACREIECPKDLLFCGLDNCPGEDCICP